MRSLWVATREQPLPTATKGTPCAATKTKKKCNVGYQGLEGDRDGSYCLVGTELQSGKMKRILKTDGGYGWAMGLYVTELYT